MAWFGFVVLLGLSIFFMGQGMHEQYLRAQLRKKAVPVEGFITDIGSIDRQDRCLVTYSYEYDGKTYAGEQTVSKETAQQYQDRPEKNVTVSCLPERPAIARLSADPTYGRTVIFAIACLAGALVFAYIAFTSTG